MQKGAIFVLVSLTVALAGCGGSGSSSSTSTPSNASPPSTAAPTSTGAQSSGPSAAGGSTVHLSAVAGKLAFDVQKLSARAGTVTISMANPASFQHGVAIQGNGVDKDGKVVGQGGTSTVTVKLKPGTYTFYCPVAGHRQAGMQGTLIVQ